MPSLYRSVPGQSEPLSPLRRRLEASTLSNRIQTAVIAVIALIAVSVSAAVITSHFTGGRAQHTLHHDRPLLQRDGTAPFDGGIDFSSPSAMGSERQLSTADYSCPANATVFVCSETDASGFAVIRRSQFKGQEDYVDDDVVWRDGVAIQHIVLSLSDRSSMLQLFPPDNKVCAPGLFLPLLMGEDSWSVGLRTTLYGIALLWSFVAVAIISDVFMAAIEVITSKEKTVTILSKGETSEVQVLVWNETVANLTLMALGSSAPEILLAVIETVSKLGDPPSDGLGPGTIVGSAAFNMCVIIGVCIFAVPTGQIRRIKELGVFTITASFSLFAYLWLLIVLSVISPDEIELWEALVTFFFFPVLVALAYFQDRGWFRGKRIHPASQLVEPGTHHMSFRALPSEKNLLAAKLRNAGVLNPALATEDMTKIEDVAARLGLAGAQRMTIARYRINANRGLTGAGHLAMHMPDIPETVNDSDSNSERGSITLPVKPLSAVKGEGETKVMDFDEALFQGRGTPDIGGDQGTPMKPPVLFSFTSPAYAVLESAGFINIPVRRSGNLDSQAFVRYETYDGTALAGEDYEHTSGLLTFPPGSVQKEIRVPIVDDNEFEPDEVFFIRLKNDKSHAEQPMQFGAYQVAEVTIINDDNPGTFTFEQGRYNVVETAGSIEIGIARKNGADGEVKVHYNTVDTASGATPLEDYTPVSGVLTFKHGEIRKTFTVPIHNDQKYEKNESFEVRFRIDGHPDNGTSYGDYKQAIITITNDLEFAKFIDKVANKIQTNLDKLKVKTETWGEQFVDAMTVGGSEEGGPGALAYVGHFVSFFWKVLFAAVPPTDMLGGWLTFAVSLVFIGLLTAIVGDLASIFGCTIGLPDAITAITFVALGTSLPDTFASKAAAVGDEHADASIGNVTGSNSVNVFLGLGLPWSIAAIYHAANGSSFIVPAGSLGFSVAVFSAICALCVVMLYLRRLPRFGGGELGGSKKGKWITGTTFIVLWLLYIVISSLQITGVF